MLSNLVYADIENDNNKIVLRMGVSRNMGIMDSIKSYFRSFILAWFIGLFTVLSTIKDMFMPFYRILYSKRHPVFVRTPEERFASMSKHGYRFQSKYLELPLGSGANDKLPRMHYIDELNQNMQTKGTILCLHGEPSWSFLYRKMIPPLVQAGYRVVVPDFIGFGKSDKYVDMTNYTHEMHLFCLKHLMDALDLRENITLVCQDWGGLVGLTMVKDLPHYFSELVIMNTGLPSGTEVEELKSVDKIQKLMPFCLWRAFVSLLGTLLPVEFFFRRVARFPSDVAEAYNAPFPSSMYKGGAAKWPLLVPLFRDDPVAEHMIEAQRYLAQCNKPVLIMFGDKDPITKGQDKMFLKLVPHAKHVTIKGASHFLQETHGLELAENIISFLVKDSI